MSKKKPGTTQGNSTSVQKKLQQALALHQAEQVPDAEKLYREILAKQPQHGETLLLLAQLLVSTGQASQSLQLLQRNALVNAKHPVARFNLGMAYLDVARFEEAVKEFQHAVVLFPAYPEAWSNRGIALQKLERHTEAINIFEQGLRYAPEQATLLINLGISLQKTGRHTEALTAFDKVLKNDPDNLALACNRLISLSALNRLEEALTSMDRALQLDPQYVDALDNRGQVLQALGRHREALQSFAQARQLAPENPRTHLHEGLCKLLLGNFEAGWKAYEWRWKMPQFQPLNRFPAKSLWLGSVPLQGKTIFVYAEQGFGDTLQFCRYIPLLAGQGAKVILEVQPPLKTLLQTLAGVDRLTSNGEPLPEFDYHCPLLSLPLAFATTLANLPSHTPYLQAAPEKQEAWKQRLDVERKKRVGLAWAGSRGFTNDANRSIPLASCLPMLSPDVQWIGLQHDLRDDDAQLLAKNPQLINVAPEFADFSEAAAVIAELDLVIAVDTAIAHLAGAMNKPVWLLLPFNPDWRWMLERSDSPWYPSARLFRQERSNDWTGIVKEVSTALKAVFPE